MSKVAFDITVSLDGFVAGPDASLEHPLGVGGEALHEWAYELESFQRLHGEEGGVDNEDSKLLEEAFAANGAIIMGRKMFSGGSGPWEDDPNADAWWGDNPPFGVPVFVLTHHPRERVEKEGGTSFTFVTDGIESALEQARAAAGEKVVAIAGGAEVIQQYLRAGVVDEFQVHVVPLLLGKGVRLFEDVGDIEIEPVRVVESPKVTHLSYRVRG
jgi:dihydrofolate reductase